MLIMFIADTRPLWSDERTYERLNKYNARRFRAEVDRPVFLRFVGVAILLEKETTVVKITGSGPPEQLVADVRQVDAVQARSVDEPEHRVLPTLALALDVDPDRQAVPGFFLLAFTLVLPVSPFGLLADALDVLRPAWREAQRQRCARRGGHTGEPTSARMPAGDG